MTVLRDSSACLTLSLLAALKAPESTDEEKRHACFEEEDEEEEEDDEPPHLGACSLTPCITLIPAWYTTLLTSLKLMPR